MLSAFNDPVLTTCETALDASAMTKQFARYLSAFGPEWSWEVVGCAIEKVYYRYGHHCGILYRLTLRHPAGAEADEWFFGRVGPRENGYNHLERAAASTKHFYVPHEFLRHIPPISYWHDLSMILWMFPQDPKIKTLSYVLDPIFVRRQIRTHLPAFGTDANGSPNGATVERGAEIDCRRVKYMPGKRCVVRFELDLTEPSGESSRISFYSKTYSDGWSRYHFDMLKSVYEQLRACAPQIHIPKPFFYLDGYNTYWQEDWGGQALIDVLEDQDWEDLFPRIAGVIAALHRTSLSGFRPGPDTDEVLNTVIEDGTKLTYLVPQFQPFIAPVLDRLRAENSTMARQTLPAVPIHGAFRIEQMLVRDAELALVDFDAVAMGDPIYDIAEFIASLRYLEISRGLSRESLLRAAESFSRRYAALVPWSFDHRRIEWYAHAFLLTKIYSSIKNLDVQALQRLELVGQEIMSGRLA